MNEFQKNCYSKCPNNTELSETKDYYCEPQCPKEYPFEVIESQECVNNCTIDEFNKKICRLNYNENNIKLMTDYLINEISKENFKISEVYKGSDIFIEEEYATYIQSLLKIFQIFLNVKKF